MTLFFLLILITTSAFGKVTDKNEMFRHSSNCQYPIERDSPLELFEKPKPTMIRNAFSFYDDKNECPMDEKHVQTKHSPKESCYTSNNEVGRLDLPMEHVHIINSEAELDEFVSNGTVQVLFFVKEILERGHLEPEIVEFLNNYNRAAKDLQSYDIPLAIVICRNFNVPHYCSRENAEVYAFGFKNGEEKIGYSTETLYNVDSIVASTLHLYLIHSVPILQSAVERKKLEAFYMNKKDIVFTYQKSLGTREHRSFLEAAMEYKDSFGFALTSYAAGAFGLPMQHLKTDTLMPDSYLWVIQCSTHSNKEEKFQETESLYFDIPSSSKTSPSCPVSEYKGNFEYSHFRHFLDTFKLPLWHELEAKDLLPDKAPPFQSPFDATHLPMVIFFFDSESKERVEGLVPHLSQILRGSVVVLTADRVILENSRVSAYLDVNLKKIRFPAICLFSLQLENYPVSWVSDFDDAFAWIKEKLTAFSFQESDTHNLDVTNSNYDLEELKQDDEMVMSMASIESDSEIDSIVNETQLRSIINKSNRDTLAVLFYLPWDPPSNYLLQELQCVSTKLKEFESLSTIKKVNCFDDSSLCDIIPFYPILKFFEKEKNSTYTGPLDKNWIIHSILINECRPNPKEVKSMEEVKLFLSSKAPSHCSPSFDRAGQNLSRAVGIFSTSEGAEQFSSRFFQALNSEYLFGYFISRSAVRERCAGDVNGCLIVSRPFDVFSYKDFILPYNVSKSEFKMVSLETFAPLDLQRHSALLSLETDISLFHFLYFPNSTIEKPALRSTLIMTEYGKKGHLKNDLKTAVLIGKIASQLKDPNVIFSYVDRYKPFRKTLMETYSLNDNSSHLVAVDVQKHHVFMCNTMKSSSASTENVLNEWVNNVLRGILTPDILLPSEEWKPSVLGCDYLKFMEEDLTRELDQQLALEIEFDLSLQFREETSRRMPHIIK